MKTVLFNTLDLALLFTMYQCLLFAGFIIFYKNKNKNDKGLSNIFLAFFLLSYVAIPLDTLINYGEAFRQLAINFSPHVFYIFGLAYWLEAVFLLFYIRTLIHKKYVFKKTDLLYLLPFVLYFVYESNQWYFLDAQTKLDILTGYKISDSPLYSRVINLSRECFRVFCGIVCLKELLQYQKQIKNEYADIEAVDLSWLKILVIGFLIVRIAAVIVILGAISSFELHILFKFNIWGMISNFVVMLLISFLILFGLNISNLFKGIDSNTSKLTEKYFVEPEQIESIKDYMIDNKPYLNHLLTIDNLSGQLFMPTRQLSHLINHEFKQNFYEFINGYRIGEAKKLLENPMNAKMTMLDVMDKAGFNSKATFNTFFKKIVNKTPTEYKKSQLNL